MDREEKEWAMKHKGESSNPFVGIEPEANYMTVEQQKRMLRSCLPDEFDSVRTGFCMKVQCRNCLLGKPGHGESKMTYGECRDYAKSLVEPVSAEEIDNPKSFDDYVREARHLADLDSDTWKRELGRRYQKRLLAVYDKWMTREEFKHPEFSKWIDVFSGMVRKYDVDEDAGRRMLEFAMNYADCNYRHEENMKLFEPATAEIMNIAEFGLKAILEVEELTRPELAICNGENESVNDVIEDMKCAKLAVITNRYSYGKNVHEPVEADVSNLFQDYVERLEAALKREGKTNTSKPRRNLDRFDNWDDAYDAWQKECVVPHPDAVAATNQGKCMRMVWLFAEWLWKPAEK